MKTAKYLLLVLLAVIPMAASARCSKKGGVPQPACELKYNADGKFKILQLTDTHIIAGDPRSERALQNINAVLDAEKPDFVIHTGDIIFGEPAAESARAARTRGSPSRARPSLPRRRRPSAGSAGRA